jgi:peptidoglycan/LPS O-acetylase OafA/YrhL
MERIKMATTTLDEVVAVPATIEPAKQIPTNKHLPALDGLRGMAILAVFMYHYGKGGIHRTSAVVRWFAMICGFGWSGVDLFFVLSGFLITGILYDTQQNPGYYRKFYFRRALRIFPIYYLFAVAALLVVPFSLWSKGHLFFLVYLGYPAALIWPSLVNLPIHITHLWSLCVEEQFYMIWPWLTRKLQSPYKILGLCATLGFGALVFRIVFPQWSYASLPSRVDDLAVGSALAILFRTDLREYCQKLAGPVFVVFGAAILAICILRGTTDHNDRLISTFGFSILAIAYGALLVLSLGPLKRFCTLPILRTFGKYSYGIYLFHFPLTTVFEHVKPLFAHVPVGSLVYVGFCLTANLAIAAVSFHLFEQPLLRLKSRFEY